MAGTIILSILSKQQAAAWQSLPLRKAAVRKDNTARRMVVSSFDLTGQGRHFVSARTGEDASSSSDGGSPGMVLDPLVVCGPSGVGKGTIIQRFQQEFPDLAQHFGFTVSHTTRNPRPGEVNGVHYHFVSHEEMHALIQADAFLESASVHSNIYGTSFSALRDVQRSGKKCLLDIDVQGVQRLKLNQDAWTNNNNKNKINASSSSSSSPSSFTLQPKYLFIAPPSLETLQDRLRARNTETPEALQTRLAAAAAEVTYGRTAGNFDAIVVNDDLESAVRDFGAAVKDLYAL